MARGNIAGAVAAGVLRAEKAKGRYKLYKKMRGAYRRTMRDKRFMRSGGAIIKLKAGMGTPEMSPANRLDYFGSTWREATPAQRDRRKQHGFYGHGLYTGSGSYWDDAKSYLWKGAKTVGRAALTAGLAGARTAAVGYLGPIGSTAAGYLGSGLYTGQGEYHTNNLISDGATSTNAVPTMQSIGDETGAICISHKEYITDIYAPGVQNGSPVIFQNFAVPLNPALQQSFTWLSQIAQNYDEYEFTQLIFHYRSTTTDIGNSATGQCGTVIMATNYNAAQPAFTDKQQMMEYAHAHSCKLTENMSHGVECDKNKSALTNCLYTRANPVLTGQDLKTYDHGKFQIAVANCPVNYNGFPIGELWVEYSCILRKPKLFTSRGLEIDLDQFVSIGTQSANARLWLSPSTASVSINNQYQPTGTDYNILAGQQNNIGCIVQSGTLASPGTNFQQAYFSPFRGTVAYGTPGLAITFPAPYTGPLEIKLSWGGCLTAASTTNAISALPQFTPVFSGNFKQINDLYNANVYQGQTAQSASPSYETAYPSNTITGLAVGAVSLCYMLHVFVSQATNGINNVLFIPLNNSSNAYVGQGMLTISQYQSNLQPLQASSTTWLNTQGAVQTPA